MQEEPETLDAELLQEEEEAEAKAEAEKARPGLTIFMDGSRLDDGGYAVAWKTRKGTGIGFAKADDPGAGHNLQGRPSRHQTDGLGGAWPRPAICAPGQEAHRYSAARSARNHHRYSMVSCPQRHRWK